MDVVPGTANQAIKVVNDGEATFIPIVKLFEGGLLTPAIIGGQYRPEFVEVPPNGTAPALQGHIGQLIVETAVWNEELCQLEPSDKETLQVLRQILVEQEKQTTLLQTIANNTAK